MRTAKYQGYANYETWLITLWIDNEEDSYSQWRNRALDIAKEKTNGKPLRGRLKRGVIAELADELKTEFTDGQPVLEGFWSDLLSSALGEVDWYEVAETRFDE